MSLVWKPAAFQEILAVLQTNKFNVIPEPPDAQLWKVLHSVYWHDQGSNIRSLFSGCLEARWHKAPMAWHHKLVLQVSIELWPMCHQPPLEDSSIKVALKNKIMQWKVSGNHSTPCLCGCSTALNLSFWWQGFLTGSQTASPTLTLPMK